MELSRMTDPDLLDVLHYECDHCSRISTLEQQLGEARTALENYQDLYGRTERTGTYQTIWRGTIHATIFVHSSIEDDTEMTEVDLCEVSGSVPVDFIAYAAAHKEDPDFIEAFRRAWRPEWLLNDAYAVEITYAWEDGDRECGLASGWGVERVVVLGVLAALTKEAQS